ncbi:hypothetical protein CDCA_CDCA18G4533 [Cyanidium caldarium]|uniref:Uncharacterized protein n=1 Tax=Cyanidium caldarium TaxID=2771 RepID=A0AAV9J2C8_CYACA|nr:hypothetical protein CDCA_CDCA18G4533 [Cyanidium caldarium]
MSPAGEVREEERQEREPAGSHVDDEMEERDVETRKSGDSGDELGQRGEATMDAVASNSGNSETSPAERGEWFTGVSVAERRRALERNLLAVGGATPPRPSEERRLPAAGAVGLPGLMQSSLTGRRPEGEAPRRYYMPRVHTVEGAEEESHDMQEVLAGGTSVQRPRQYIEQGASPIRLPGMSGKSRAGVARERAVLPELRTAIERRRQRYVAEEEEEEDAVAAWPSRSSPPEVSEGESRHEDGAHSPERAS